MKVVWQKQQGYVFSECTLIICILSFLFLENFFSQIVQEICLDILWCSLCLCSSKDLLEINIFPHSWHDSDSILLCSSRMDTNQLQLEIIHSTLPDLFCDLLLTVTHFVLTPNNVELFSEIPHLFAKQLFLVSKSEISSVGKFSFKRS